MIEDKQVREFVESLLKDEAKRGDELLAQFKARVAGKKAQPEMKDEAARPIFTSAGDQVSSSGLPFVKGPARQNVFPAHLLPSHHVGGVCPLAGRGRCWMA